MREGEFYPSRPLGSSPRSPLAASCNEAGIDAFFPILRQVTTLEEAMDPQTAQKNMESAVEQVFRVIRLKERNW